jgi:hypothetical protein
MSEFFWLNFQMDAVDLYRPSEHVVTLIISCLPADKLVISAAMRGK